MITKKPYPLLPVILLTTLFSNISPIDDDMFIDEINNPSHIQEHITERDCCTPCKPSTEIPQASDLQLESFRNLLVEVGIPGTLAKNFFKGTNPVQSRSLLDLPSTGLDLTIYPQNCKQLSLNAFYNQTSAMVYRCNGRCIGSYIAISNPDILEEIDEAVLDPITIPDVIDLFLRLNPFKLQERRAGVMINYNQRWGSGTFGFNLPFYYLEHNFFLTEAQQAFISQAPLFQNFGPTDTDNDAALDFGYKNLFSDALGFGDLRLNGYYAFKDTEKHYATIGGVLTLPIAFALTNHVFGGKYCKTLPRRQLSMIEVANIYYSDLPQTTQLLQDMFVNYGVCFLHQLTANIAYTSMGNNHHVTFGPRFEYQYKVHPCLQLKLYSDIQYFCPASEKRFYIPKDRTDTQDYTSDNPAVVKENLNFISQQLEDFLFPYCVNTLVSPGFLINFSAATVFQTKRTNIEFGYNFWRQSTEHIKLPHSGICFDVCKGVKAGAYQNSFYARFMLNMPEHCGGLHIGFYGDVAFKSYNIGNQFTLASNIEFYY